MNLNHRLIFQGLAECPAEMGSYFPLHRDRVLLRLAIGVVDQVRELVAVSRIPHGSENGLCSLLAM